MNSLGDTIINSLTKNNYNCKYESNNREISSRCPYCGGGSKRTKRQFYIKVDNPPYLFHCFRCGVSGTLSKLIIDFPELFSDVIKNFNSEILKYDTETIDDYYSNKVVVNKSNELCESCSWYLSKRISPTLFDSIKDKVICCKDLREVDSNLENFIGFQSIDSSQIICRNKEHNSSFRYKNLKISDERYFSYLYFDYLYDICNADYYCVVGEGLFTVLGGIDKLIEKFNKQVNVIGIASLSKSRLYYLSKYVVPTLPFKFKKIYVILDRDSDIDKQVERYSSLINVNKYEIVIPNDSKDLGENISSYLIKNSKKEVVKCLKSKQESIVL